MLALELLLVWLSVSTQEMRSGVVEENALGAELLLQVLVLLLEVFDHILPVPVHPPGQHHQ